ncbi:protein kinase [Streptantibioticus rubrisoli]|uniref:non-specific serine/threonine protein kinase n=1 Tax=Streptantibioticus rubrisoli TaxID=1387313 RepID=A0ABT1PA32_9ACTN|nr:protein kinase [Streptantibioticus rubrisoli]MCQ4042216.1 protein kinase [Streptantibioticus rubrisoli]
MDQTQPSGDPEESSALGAEAYDTPELWGANGFMGDGRYRLTRRLGRGGMAEVFAAEDVRLGRTVAVKLLRSDLAEDPVSKARFTREAQSVAGLNHHAVVAVYDSGEDRVGNNVVPYIVMELCEGRTIRDLLINSEAPPVDQALIIVSGVLEALAYSHQHGIVHRDIKPANVIITNTGAVKVMDFGIARALHGASTTMTQTGMVMGTPQYLSPEQALGKAVDHRSDLYATGCLLYELLTLRPPFTGETPLSVVYQHVQDDPRIPSDVNDRVPPELDGMVLRALAKNPDDRFQSAEEMHGLVQYALRMLHEQGGWTGAWDTGYVDHSASAASAAGTAATTVLPHAQAGHTAELGPPLLMGPPGGEGTGGYGDGGHGNGGRDGRGGGGHRGRNTVLLVLAAILAISLGVVFAVSMSHGSGKGGTANEHSPAPSVSQSASPSDSPSDSSSPSDQPSVDTSSGQGGDNSTGEPSYPTHSREPSSQPPSSEPPSSPPPSSPGTSEGTTNQGTSQGGTNSGTTSGTGGNSGTSSGNTTGTSQGSTDGQTSGTSKGTTSQGGTIQGIG